MRATVLWSDRYDAEPKDIFSVQDRITRRISGALAIQVSSLELAMSAAKPPDNLEAYDLVLQGRELAARATRVTSAQARGLFERAIKLDPNYAAAYVGLGTVELYAALLGWTPDPAAALERAEALARKTIALDAMSSGAHALLGRAAASFGEHDRALDELKRAIELNGSDAESYANLIDVLLFRGDAEGAIEAGRTLLNFEPDLPPGPALHLGLAYLVADRSAEAARILERVVPRHPGNAYLKATLAAAYAEAGRQPDAERQSAEIRQRFPTFSAQQFGSALRNPEQRGKLARALQKAGL
jgi:tetratricopeptide (TPR) repeat protein